MINYYTPRTPWLGDLAWEILPRPIWAGWAGPDPIFFGGPHPPTPPHPENMPNHEQLVLITTNWA